MEEKLLKMRSAIIEITQYKKQMSDLKEKLSDDEFRLKRKQYSDHTGHIGKEALEARVETTKKVMQELEKRIEACKREITKVAYSIEELEGFNEKLREAKGKAKDNIEKLDERRQKLKNEKKVLKYRQKIEQIDLSNEIASIETQIAEIGQLVKLENAKIEVLMPEKERIEAERNTLIDIREIMTNDGNEESNENEEKTVQEYAETDEELRKLLEARNKADMEESYNEMSQSEDGIDRSKEINKARKEKEALDKQIKIKLAEIKGKEKPKGKKTKKSEYTLASLKEAVGKIDEQLIKIKAQKKDKSEPATKQDDDKTKLPKKSGGKFKRWLNKNKARFAALALAIAAAVTAHVGLHSNNNNSKNTTKTTSVVDVNPEEQQYSENSNADKNSHEKFTEGLKEMNIGIGSKVKVNYDNGKVIAYYDSYGSEPIADLSKYDPNTVFVVTNKKNRNVKYWNNRGKKGWIGWIPESNAISAEVKKQKDVTVSRDNQYTITKTDKNQKNNNTGR